MQHTMTKQSRGHVDDDDGEIKKTRIDGIGLWRSWKRNFNDKQLALLDLIDNSLDAAIDGENSDSDGSSSSDGHVGRVHVYSDVFEGTSGRKKISNTTGLCIVNNSMKPIRPLESVLEVYNSSKVDSGAGDIGENGVGLKQGCATLSDLSFVLVKNGSDDNIELGIIAKSMQRKDGCYLPAFKFTNAEDAPPLKDQMNHLFSRPTYKKVAECISQYGAASDGLEPNLTLGIQRLCKHADHICHNFHHNPYVFLLILDKLHYGESEEGLAWTKQQKITVTNLMRDLRKAISRTYLHFPSSSDFLIDGQRADFKYWPERLVELSSFTVNINRKISWEDKLDSGDHPESYPLRVFVGFDGMRVTDTDSGKEASLYIYSRQSGRLIKQEEDARLLLGLSAGGSAFCQGLTVIIDDIEGRLPLNPTKQDIAFGEETHGESHKKNLMAWVGSVVHFFYSYHLGKFGDKKTDLTKKIAEFGDRLLETQDDPDDLETLDDSDLTTYHLKFKSIGKYIRVDKNSAREDVGSDTLHRLVAKKSKSRTAAAKSSRTTSTRKRKATTENDSRPATSQAIPKRRRQPASYKEQESESDEGEIHEAPAIPKRRRSPPSNDEQESESDEGEIVESNSDDSEPRAKPASNSRSSKAISKQNDGNKNISSGHQNSESEADENNGGDSEEVALYKGFCAQLTKKFLSQKEKVKSLERDLAEERNLTSSQKDQMSAMQKELAVVKAQNLQLQRQINNLKDGR